MKYLELPSSGGDTAGIPVESISCLYELDSTAYLVVGTDSNSIPVAVDYDSAHNVMERIFGDNLVDFRFRVGDKWPEYRACIRKDRVYAVFECYHYGTFETCLFGGYWSFTFSLAENYDAAVRKVFGGLPEDAVRELLVYGDSDYSLGKTGRLCVPVNRINAVISARGGQRDCAEIRVGDRSFFAVEPYEETDYQVLGSDGQDISEI